MGKVGGVGSGVWALRWQGGGVVGAPFSAPAVKRAVGRAEWREGVRGMANDGKS